MENTFESIGLNPLLPEQRPFTISFDYQGKHIEFNFVKPITKTLRRKKNGITLTVKPIGDFKLTKSGNLLYTASLTFDNPVN